MAPKVLVTMALPYANGSIHLGHLVEAVQTDVYVRALKAAGRDVVYVCADDTHGTPIEVNAAKAGIPPEQFVARFHAEHKADYDAFEIGFDEFYTTHSPENEKHARAFFEALRADGGIEKRDIEQLYCEVDKRFLPDRFVKGNCPNCGAPDQYGDACEKCGKTYDPTDLKDPYCSLCWDQGRGKVAPVRRTSSHYFVRLSKYQDFLRTWITREGTLQPEIRRSIDAWMSEPLKDWDISRDAPYFGFKIPGEDAKYFYVWLDAPIGYLSTTDHWASKRGRSPEEWWSKDADAEVVHFIGKDIVYFHTLFWPAMLHAAGRKTPSKVHVHGMLTVEGAKMSKSRGTFINAREYLDAGLDPEWLRYFYASNLGPSPSDIDLSLAEMKNRVNGELNNNLGNLANRSLSVLWRSFDGQLTKISDWADAQEIWRQAQVTEAEARKGYANVDYRYAIQQILVLGAMANERLQRMQPWKLLATDRAAAQRELTLAINVMRVCARLIAPVAPRFAAGVEAQLGAKLAWGDWSFLESGRVNEPKPLVRRMEDADVLKLASRFVPAEATPSAPSKRNAPTTPGGPKALEKAAEAAGRKPDAPAAAAAGAGAPGEIGIEAFAAVDLRAGKVLACERVPKADKLLKLSVDLGEGAPRTIVSGIAQAYAPEELVGKNVVIVANLAKKPLRGIESHGMILAATGGPRGLTVVELPAELPAGAKVK